MSGPDSITVAPFFQNKSVCILYWIHFCNAKLNFNIKSVPGVIQFESNRLPLLLACICCKNDDEEEDDDTLAIFIRALSSDCNNSASLAERNRRARC